MPWHHINTRRISLQMCLFWNDGFHHKESHAYGIGCKNFLNFFDGKKTAYYVSQEDWEAYRAGQEKLLTETKWVKTIPWEAQTFLELQLQRFRATFPKNVSVLTNEALLTLQRHVATEVGWTNSRTWMIYLINDLIANKVKQFLSERLESEEKVAQLLLDFSTPLEPNDAVKERIALLRLAIDRTRLLHDEFERRLATHTTHFNHIPMFGFDHDPYTIDHFKKELDAMADPVTELHQLEATMRDKKAHFENELHELGLSPTDPLLDLILMLKHTVFVRDYRDTLRQKMYLLDRSMYKEIGQRLGGLTVAQTTNLTNQEIESGLLNKKEFDFAAIAREREHGFLVIEHNTAIEVYSGAHACTKARAELPAPVTHDAQEITGVAAARGTGRGPARIVETNQDLGKVQPGDVMIAHVTRQDFVPAMKKCVAIVTTEGGITNHAAIIAREFGLPCVVGAKEATMILKDGETIEVDGDRGKVKRDITTFSPESSRTSHLLVHQ